MTTQEKNLYQPYLTSGRRSLTCSISDPHRGCWDRTSISPRIVDRLLDQTPATVENAHATIRIGAELYTGRAAVGTEWFAFVIDEYTASAMDICTKDQLFGTNGH